MKYAFSNFGKVSAWMVDDGLINEEQTSSFNIEIEEVTELPAEAGWHYGIEELTPPKGWYGFELINEPGSYYVTNKAYDVIMKYCYIASEGYAPRWISKPLEATNKVIRRVRNIFYY